MSEVIPAPELRALIPFIGTWDTAITELHPDGRPGDISTAVDTYRWVPGGQFLLHEVDATIQGQRRQSLEIFARSPDGVGYVSRSYEADGTFGDYQVLLADEVWKIDGDLFRFNGQFEPGFHRLSGIWDAKGERGWTAAMRVSLVKRPM